MYVINNDTKIVNEWADTEINQQRAESGSLGVVLYEGEVEQGYDGLLYAKGYAPTQSQEELNAQRIAEIDAELSRLDTKAIRPSSDIALAIATGSPVNPNDVQAIQEIDAKKAVLREERNILDPSTNTFTL